MVDTHGQARERRTAGRLQVAPSRPNHSSGSAVTPAQLGTTQLRSL